VGWFDGRAGVLVEPVRSASGRAEAPREAYRRRTVGRGGPGHERGLRVCRRHLSADRSRQRAPLTLLRTSSPFRRGMRARRCCSSYQPGALPHAPRLGGTSSFGSYVVSLKPYPTQIALESLDLDSGRLAAATEATWVTPALASGSPVRAELSHASSSPAHAPSEAPAASASNRRASTRGKRKTARSNGRGRVAFAG
jgi:hypothetical protein